MANEPTVALVTGAAKRVGRAIVTRLHAAGLPVAIHYRGSRDAAEALAQALNEQRPRSAVALQADLSDAASLSMLVQSTVETFGALSLLVNNASSFHPTPVTDADADDWNDLFTSNARGPFFLSQAAIPHLRRCGGNIVNILDVHAERPMRGHTVYCMAKAALMMMTRSLALELAPEIRVNGVSPGAILWPSSEPDDAEKQRTLARIPMRRTGEPDDIASAVEYLALGAPYVTGQVLRIDGGRSLNM